MATLTKETREVLDAIAQLETQIKQFSFPSKISTTIEVPVGMISDIHKVIIKNEDDKLYKPGDFSSTINYYWFSYHIHGRPNLRMTIRTPEHK